MLSVISSMAEGEKKGRDAGDFQRRRREREKKEGRKRSRGELEFFSLFLTMGERKKKKKKGGEREDRAEVAGCFMPTPHLARRRPASERKERRKRKDRLGAPLKIFLNSLGGREKKKKKTKACQPLLEKGGKNPPSSLFFSFSHFEEKIPPFSAGTGDGNTAGPGEKKRRGKGRESSPATRSSGGTFIPIGTCEMRRKGGKKEEGKEERKGESASFLPPSSFATAASKREREKGGQVHTITFR